MFLSQIINFFKLFQNVNLFFQKIVYKKVSFCAGARVFFLRITKLIKKIKIFAHYEKILQDILVFVVENITALSKSIHFSVFVTLKSLNSDKCVGAPFSTKLIQILKFLKEIYIIAVAIIQPKISIISTYVVSETSFRRHVFMKCSLATFWISSKLIFLSMKLLIHKNVQTFVFLSSFQLQNYRCNCLLHT